MQGEAGTRRRLSPGTSVDCSWPARTATREPGGRSCQATGLALDSFIRRALFACTHYHGIWAARARAPYERVDSRLWANRARLPQDGPPKTRSPRTCRYLLHPSGGTSARWCTAPGTSDHWPCEVPSLTSPSPTGLAQPSARSERERPKQLMRSRARAVAGLRSQSNALAGQRPGTCPGTWCAHRQTLTDQKFWR